jgi:hypothetical protein
LSWESTILEAKDKHVSPMKGILKNVAQKIIETINSDKDTPSTEHSSKFDEKLLEKLFLRKWFYYSASSKKLIDLYSKI